ncbi:PfkB family carbohydrate kinase [Cellulomonas sp. ATA003]|uniref:PfkB family carbohydrate kinase n=1 Tax=Cellulomonas sp. ATA003 TaxID=3073064 RepID=UPI002873652D|nr:PfkB family carbohydrate kinase [Cellulomonas sp. ATA003]WNB84555.1 PfkB family carbohydrate kinase [Cellulomonas sp. ATA003]
MPDVVVVGEIGRDLVLGVDAIPEPGGSADVTARREVLGGKGANQAVGLRCLAVGVGLVGVVGDDAAGADVLAQAERDGIDVSGVVRRAGAPTALLVDVVEPDGVRRLLESVDDAVRLTAEDVRAAEPLIASARLLLVQLQQPGPAVREALRLARAHGVRVVADGAPADDETRRAVLGGASVVRADDTEAALLLDRDLGGVDAAVDAAAALLDAGPDVVALAVGTEANVLAWSGGQVVMPLIDSEPVDPTGGGDAFVAGLAAALLRGDAPEAAGWFASAAAAATVSHLGGRPDLDRARLDEVARLTRAEHDAAPR